MSNGRSHGTDPDHTFDVVVIGLGLGGEEVAGSGRGRARWWARDRLVGGECPYWGCVPTKMMIRAADLLAEARRIAGMAGRRPVTPDWAPVARASATRPPTTGTTRVAVERFEGKGGTVRTGPRPARRPGEVEVDGDGVRRAAGDRRRHRDEPVVPPIDGLAGTPYWTNREAIEATELPGVLIVLGGGAIGVELAQVFARFGVAVTVVEAPTGCSPSRSRRSATVLAAARRPRASTCAPACGPPVGHDGDASPSPSADGHDGRGRASCWWPSAAAPTWRPGARRAWAWTSTRPVPVDERLRVGRRRVGGRRRHRQGRVHPHGDVPGRHRVRRHPRRATPAAGRLQALPRVTFTDPEVGAVGLTEEQARERGIDVRTGHAEVRPSPRLDPRRQRRAHQAGRGRRPGRAGGRDVGGPAGGEVLGLLALAVHAEVPVDTLRTMIYAYPTFHRGIEDALARLV